MNKKILAVLVLAMVLVMTFAACKNNEYEETGTTNESTTAQKHVSIVTGPDDDGFFGEDIIDPNTGEKIESTSNSTPSSSDKGNTTGTSNGGKTEDTPSTAPSEETTSSQSVNVGRDPKQASVKWSDIKNA